MILTYYSVDINWKSLVEDVLDNVKNNIIFVWLDICCYGNSLFFFIKYLFNKYFKFLVLNLLKIL